MEYDQLDSFPLHLPPKATKCLKLEDPDNGQVSFGSSFVGASATYSCKQGFKLIGVRHRTCQIDGTWSGEAPICKSKQNRDWVTHRNTFVNLYLSLSVIVRCRQGLWLCGLPGIWLCVPHWNNLWLHCVLQLLLRIQTDRSRYSRLP